MASRNCCEEVDLGVALFLFLMNFLSMLKKFSVQIKAKFALLYSECLK